MLAHTAAFEWQCASVQLEVLKDTGMEMQWLRIEGEKGNKLHNNDINQKSRSPTLIKSQLTHESNLLLGGGVPTEKKDMYLFLF